MTRIHGHSLTSHQLALPGERERCELAGLTSHHKTRPKKLQAFWGTPAGAPLQCGH